MHRFDPYEYIGVIVPGVIVVLAAMVIYPTTIALLANNVSLGELGLILIISLIAGHILQALGNVFEKFFWLPFGGMPTAWPSCSKRTLLAVSQTERLRLAIKNDFGSELDALKAGRGVVREIASVVAQKGSTERLEAFNRNYGLMRGVACGFLAAAVLVLVEMPHAWRISILLTLAFIAAAYRMKRFGEHYARELYVEYLQTQPPSEAK